MQSVAAGSTLTDRPTMVQANPVDLPRETKCLVLHRHPTKGQFHNHDFKVCFLMAVMSPETRTSLPVFVSYLHFLFPDPLIRPKRGQCHSWPKAASSARHWPSASTPTCDPWLVSVPHTATNYFQTPACSHPPKHPCCSPCASSPHFFFPDRRLSSPPR